jgi:hypothetical protein
MATVLYARTTAPTLGGSTTNSPLNWFTTARAPAFGSSTTTAFLPANNSTALSTTVGTGSGLASNASTVNGPTNGIRCQPGYTSDVVAADITISGTVTFNLCGLESSMNANIALKGALYRIDEFGVATLIAEATGSTEVGTALTRQSPTATPTSTLVKKGHRLHAVFGIDDGGGNMATGFTGSVQINGANASTADTNVTLTENVTFITADPTGTAYWLRDTASALGGIVNDLSQTQGAATAEAVHTTVAGPTTYLAEPWTETAGGSDIEWTTPGLDAFTLGGVVFVELGKPGSASHEAGPGVGVNDVALLEIAVVDSDGSNPVPWARSYFSSTSTGGSVSRYYLSGPDVSVAQGKRLRFRVYQDDDEGQNASSGTNRTIRYGGVTTYASRIVFTQTITEAVGAPTVVTRYVNTASTAGGDGTTNATAGATRAFASLNEAVDSSAVAKNLGTANEQVTIHCSGTAADTTPVSFPAACVTTATCYVEIIGDAPSSLQYSTSHYRLESSSDSLWDCTGPRHVRVSRLQSKHTVGAGASGVVSWYWEGANGSTAADIRMDRVHAWAVISASRTSQVIGFRFHAPDTSGYQYAVTNSVTVGYRAAGATHAGIVPTKSTATEVYYNNTVYDCGYGFQAFGAAILKNNGATNCDTPWTGAAGSGSTNNASSSGTVLGASGRTSVTPTFVDAAGGNYHLSASDTAWKDFGATLSSDATYPITADGDGVTRTGTWDIGADEFAGTTYTQDVSGAFTPAGALPRRASKVTAAAFTPSGALVRHGLKTLSAAFTPAGALVRRDDKTLAGAFTPAGALAASAVKFQTVAGVATPSGALVLRAAHVLAGTLTTAGALVRRTDKTTAGALTSSATLSPRVGLKILVASLAPEGSLSPSAVKTATVSGSLATSGALVRRADHALAGTLATAGDIDVAVRKVLAGALTSSATLSPRVGLKILVGVLAPAGELVSATVKLTTVSGSLATGGALSRRATHTLAAELVPSGALARHAQHILAGVLASAGAVVRQNGKVVSGAVTPAGAVTPLSLKARTLAGTVTPAGAVLLRTGHPLAGGLTASGALTKRDAKILAGSLTTVGAFSSTKVALLQLAGALTTSGALTRLEAKILTAALASSGALTRRDTRTLFAELGLVGDVTRLTAISTAGLVVPTGDVVPTRALAQTFVGTLAPGGDLARHIATTLAATLALSGFLVRDTGDVLVLLDVTVSVVEGSRWTVPVFDAGSRWDVPVQDEQAYTIPVQET